MKFAEINKAFTGKVAEYIAKGYRINTATMAGHQGEIGKVDLTDGKELVRVLLERDCDYCHDLDSRRHYWYEFVRLTVGKATGRFELDTVSDWCTVWNKELDVIETGEWYEINQRRRKAWYGTKAEFEAAADKRSARGLARKTSSVAWWSDSEAAKKAVLPFVKRQKGLKTCKASDVESVLHTVETDCGGNLRNHYVVSVKGKKITIK